eukprot:scaffold175_cov177-Amphora_coffeaeformis.AAC.16
MQSIIRIFVVERGIGVSQRARSGLGLVGGGCARDSKARIIHESRVKDTEGVPGSRPLSFHTHNKMMPLW